MVASEILQMSSNALAIIRNPVVFPKSNFYDAYTLTEAASSWKALVETIGEVKSWYGTCPARLIR
jgi:hypothetical protein